MKAGFKWLTGPLFLSCAAMYAINKAVMVYVAPHGYAFFHNYFNDLLLVPVVLPVILLISARLGLREEQTPPTLTEVLVVIVVWSIAFEVAGPMFLERGTSDVLDAGAYTAGGLLSWMIWNRRVRAWRLGYDRTKRFLGRSSV